MRGLSIIVSGIEIHVELSEGCPMAGLLIHSGYVNTTLLLMLLYLFHVFGSVPLIVVAGLCYQGEVGKFSF